MKNRKVRYVIPAETVDMDGMPTKQALPTNKVGQVGPFLLLHHGRFSDSADAPAVHQGIGPHPHRGFSSASFIIEGELQHRDSWGNNHIAGAGEVQWLHAGAGIIHSERPSQALADRNGQLEMVQIWINSPASRKMSPPTFQTTSEDESPIFWSEDKLIENKLIAGNYNGMAGKIATQSKTLVIWSKTSAGGTQSLRVSVEFETMLYVIKGELRISGYGRVEPESLVVFDNGSEEIEVTANTDAQFLLLSGAAIPEKVVQQGPFVMNTETEILQAMRDFQMGKMGVLIEENEYSARRYSDHFPEIEPY